MNVWKTNKKAAVWAVLALVLTARAADRVRSAAGRAELPLHRLHFLCIDSGAHGALQRGKAGAGAGGRLAAGVCRGQLSGGARALLTFCSRSAGRINSIWNFPRRRFTARLYIEGIGNLYEFDCGAESGWMYAVNGWFPNYGCSQYALQDGDTVTWVYTCDLGRDVGSGGWTEGE